jgi:hypothetical protein
MRSAETRIMSKEQEPRTKRVQTLPNTGLKASSSAVTQHHPKSIEGNKKAVHDFHMEHHAHYTAQQIGAVEKKTNFQKEHAKECLSHPHEINAYKTRMHIYDLDDEIANHGRLANHHAHEATSPGAWDELKG